MGRILKKRELVKDIFEMIIEAPLIAAKAEPGHFVLVMPEAKGERIPLTIADFDREAGTITLVIMVVGTTSMKTTRLPVGGSLYAIVGPLGHPSEIENFGTVVMVAGGVGTAPIFPIARRLHDVGNRVVSVHGARSKGLLFWEDKIASVSDEHIITTDDGSYGRKGLVTEPLKEILEADRDAKKIGCVYAIGPAVMMKFCALTVKPFGVRSIASLNSVMVDGTGMCGGCRVDVGGKTLFTCVDGPEFDAQLVDWDTLMKRQKIYIAEEKCSLDKYIEEAGIK
jgi:ferredoxin--NADP+ reductase